MGKIVQRRPVTLLASGGVIDMQEDAVFSSTAPAGAALANEAVTLSTATKTLKNQGVSFITYGTSGKPSDFIIPDPPRAGAQKLVVLDNQTTSAEANGSLASTARVFFGTTFNTVTIAASSSQVNNFFGLTAVSTSQWAVTSLSSTNHWSFSASTGSTSQA